MATKINLPNGTVLEYEGEVIVSADGSMTLPAATNSVDEIVEKPVPKNPLCDEALVLLDPSLIDTEAIVVDKLINISDVYFDVLQCARQGAEAGRVREWTLPMMARKLEITRTALANRVSDLVYLELLSRVERGLYVIDYTTCDVFTAYYDEILAERSRRAAIRNPRTARYPQE